MGNRFKAWQGIRKNRQTGGKRRFYRKSLIVLLLVSGIPGLITGALVYWMAGGRLESELLSMHNEQIQHRAHNVDEQLSNLELMLSHWAFDTKFNYTLRDTDFVSDFIRSRDITNTLLVMQGSNTMVKKVELYVDGKQPVLFDPEFSEASSMSDTYQGLLQSDRQTYWTQWAFDAAHPDDKELTLVHHVPGGQLKPVGMLLLRLDHEKVGELLRTMMPYNDGETFLLKDTGELYGSIGSEPESDFVNALTEVVHKRGTGEGSFFFDWGGKTYTVTYGHFSRIQDEWSYVSASPISTITAPVMFISKLILIVSGSALLIAAVLAWLASRSIYSPIDRLVRLLTAGKPMSEEKEDEFAMIERQWQLLSSESRELHTRWAEQLPQVKESFLHQLLQGYLYAYSEQELQKRMERYKWEVQGRTYLVLYVQLTGIANMDGKFRYGDEGLVTFAAVNVIEELASRHYEQSSVVNFHDLSAALLIVVANEESYEDNIRAYCAELTDAVNRMLQMQVTIAISRPTHRIADIPLAFENAKQAAGYRSVESGNGIVDIEALDDSGKDGPEFTYPFTLEREFVQALRTGQEDEANRLLDAFIRALAVKGAKEFDVQQGMLHLLGSVQHAIMVSGIYPGRLFKGANLYEQLSQMREPERLADLFRDKVIVPFLKELGERSHSQTKRMIEGAMLYLQQHYMRDVSLDSCADHIGTNPFYLSKMFKQVTGKNFIDYLTELRLERAKELLRESELKINCVAEQVGYQHSYFNRIFKKTEGITPSRYREMSRSS
ncbi:HTH-type transcriptional regulator YesS [Paenibacillus sp. CCS19]|uniref:helix-turn-helix domain-containing protein n=1 Tax=Paenibacillus sp. CCS19 TaxID=3158387 RepID=UPI00255E5C7A|nr:helix-turn-helix domain-containing protein [Paenibacillus cellulosilyticus]GMK42038.1 HTH-type transcriptional regulator YesS [Paenibacillus cellulosilyticus]